MNLSPLTNERKMSSIPLILPDEEVHVWCASLEQPVWAIEQLARILSADELERAARFHFEAHRYHFIVAHGMLRMVLGQYLGFDPALLRFEYETYGKPKLAQHNQNGVLNFNLSHSHKLALLAITRHRPIGVDLEYMRPVLEMEQIAAGNFSAVENRLFQALPDHQKHEAFFNCWTRKEAYIKAIGEGLTHPLDQFEVSLTPDELPRLINVTGHPDEAAYWSLQTFSPAPGYIAALAVKGHDWRLIQRQWKVC